MSDEDVVVGRAEGAGVTAVAQGTQHARDAQHAGTAAQPAHAGGSTAAEDAEPTEVEWQFDALDLRPVERWLAALPSRTYADVPTLTVLAKPTRRLVDRYMDTSDWRIGQAGFVLRTRQRGRAAEVTMKDTRPADPGGLRRRLELTESLPSGLAALGPKGPVGRRVQAVAGRRPLVQVLEVRTRRQPFSLRAAGAEVAEVALDDTTIVVGPHQAPARLRRVEVEVVPGWVDTLGPVVQDLRESAGLSPAVLSKFEAGMLAAGITMPGPPDVGSTDIPTDATIGDVAYAMIRRQVRELFVHEPGTRLGEDAEELHDMRVATRRLRAAMDIFSSALPSRAAAVREELRWIAAELGAVRDLDVQLADMGQMARWSDEWAGAERGAALGHLRTLLDAERDEARRKLLYALDSPRWERLSAALVALARQGPSRRVPGARVPAAIAVPPLLDERHRAMRSAAKRAHRSGIAHDFHRVRIRGKRLRYSLEFTSALYGQPAVRFAKKLTQLQDLLGNMQDAEVASSRLFSLATETPPPGTSLPPATVFVMGGIAERYRQESAQLREIMPKKLKLLRSSSWKKLEATVDRARRHAEMLTTSTQHARPARTAPVPAAAADGVNGEKSGTPDVGAGTERFSPVAASASPAPDVPAGPDALETAEVRVAPDAPVHPNAQGHERVEARVSYDGSTEWTEATASELDAPSDLPPDVPSDTPPDTPPGAVGSMLVISPTGVSPTVISPTVNGSVKSSGSPPSSD